MAAMGMPSDDFAPADRQPAVMAGAGYKGRHGALKTGIVSTYAFLGMAIGRVDTYDGMLIAANAEACADAWLAWGKADPRVMKALTIMFGSPIGLVVMAHTPILLGVLKHHNASPMALFSAPKEAGDSSARRVGSLRAAAADATVSAPPPLPYQPVGPTAPTENTPAPPPVLGDSAPLVVPDEGIPAELDVALREAARMTGRPYAELRQEAIIELAQLRMNNGHAQAPGALGAPVARE